MIVWPAITNPDLTFASMPQRPTIRSSFQDGHRSTRAKYSKGLSTFKLKWQGMNPSDFSLLEDFYIDHIGDRFDWTDPTTSATHVVIFKTESLKTKVFANAFRQLELELQEVAD